MKHIILAGDSIFDNRPYVEDNQPAVIDQLTKAVGARNKATLRAVDGAVTANVAEQLRDIPSSSTHLVISVGGNDGLQATSIFRQPVTTVGEALQKLYQLRVRFEREYRDMVSQAGGFSAISRWLSAATPPETSIHTTAS